MSGAETDFLKQWRERLGKLEDCVNKGETVACRFQRLRQKGLEPETKESLIKEYDSKVLGKIVCQAMQREETLVDFIKDNPRIISPARREEMIDLKYRMLALMARLSVLWKMQNETMPTLIENHKKEKAALGA